MDILDLRDKLPHGAQREIAKRTNYSESAICLFFNGKKKLSKYSEILNTAADILKEEKDKEIEAKEQLNKILSL